MSGLKELDKLLKSLPAEILELEVVEVCGDEPDSIHVTRMSTSLSYGLVAALNGKGARSSGYGIVGAFKTYDEAMTFANNLEDVLRKNKRCGLCCGYYAKRRYGTPFTMLCEDCYEGWYLSEGPGRAKGKS